MAMLLARYCRRLPLPLCLALLALVAALGACSKPPTIDSLLADAKQFQSKGDTHAAVIQLKNLLRQNPKHGEARYLLGTIYLQGGDALKAETQFHEALQAKYDAKLVLPRLAQALFQQGKFQQLLDETRSSDLGEAALQPEIISLRGHAYLSLDKPDEAARSFEEALQLKHDFAPALLGQVRVALQKQNAVLALGLVDRAVAADPKTLDGWLMKGDIERLLKGLDAAEAAYRKAIALEPSSVAANFNMASVAMAQGKIDETRKYIGAIRTAAPNNPVGYYLLGLVEFREKNYKAANEAIQQVLTKAPNHLPAKALSAAIIYHTGSNEQAEHQLREVLAQSPNSVYLRKLLAATLLKGRKVQAALEILEPLIKTASDDSGLLALIADAYYQRGDLVRAKRYFEMAAKKSPENPQARIGLGLSRLAAGETERALADLDAAVDFSNSDSDVFLVKSLLSAKLFDKAWAAVERLEKNKPADPEVLNIKGTVQLARKNYTDARKTFERALEKQPGYFPANMNLAALEVHEKKYEAARMRYEKIIEEGPENIEAMLALADLAHITGKQGEAISWQERARVIQPRAFAPNYALANSLFNQGDYAGAVPVLKDALAVQPNHPEALNMLGYSQIRLGKPDDALSTYTKLITLYPKSAMARFGLSGVELARGNKLAARLTLQRVLELQPDFPEAIYSLSNLYVDAGKIADAMTMASQAQARYPKSALGFLIEGNAQMAENKYALAARAYEQAFRLEKSGPLVLNLHKAMVKSNRAAAANTLLVNWLKDNPDDIPARLYYADAALKEDDYPLAIEQYEYVLRKQPQDLGVLHNLGWSYRQQKNMAKALQTAEQAYKINSDSPAVLVDLADLLLEQGHNDRAIKLLEKAKLIQPASQEIRYRLAKAYLAVDNKVAARNELKQLLGGGGEFNGRDEATALFEQLSR